MESLIASIASSVRQHAGDGEETDLHDRVDPAAHAAVPRNFVGVDDKETRLRFELALAWTDFGKCAQISLCFEWRVQQKCPAR